MQAFATAAHVDIKKLMVILSISILHEQVVEDKTEDQRRRLTRLSTYMDGEAR